jgi:hypothetical protein
MFLNVSSVVERSPLQNNYIYIYICSSKCEVSRKEIHLLVANDIESLYWYSEAEKQL